MARRTVPRKTIKPFGVASLAMNSAYPLGPKNLAATTGRREQPKRVILVPLMPSKRSMVYSATLVIFGTVFDVSYSEAGLATGVAAVAAVASFALLIRWKPLMKLSFIAGQESLEPILRKEAKGFLLNGMAVSAALLVPFILLFFLPFSEWVVLIYVLISSWPLSNLVFATLLYRIETKKRVKLFRVTVVENLAGEDYPVAKGYSVQVRKE
jgi:hypothetical protein